MTARESCPSRLVRRCSNGELFDTLEGGPVTLDFEDRTAAVLGPALLSRLRRDAGSPRTVEGIALARAMSAVSDMRAAFVRMHDRLTGLEHLLQAAVDRDAANHAKPGATG